MRIKFNLGWILAIAAAIVVAAMGFMSFYYLTGGNLVLPSIIGVSLLVLPVVVNMYLVPAKECAKPFYFHKEAIKEAVLLATMLVLFIASMPLVNHFFTVNGRTEMIEESIDDQRRQLDEMQLSYKKHIENRETIHRAYLNEVLNNKNRDIETYNKVFPNGSNDIELMVHSMVNKISLNGLKDSISVFDNSEIKWWQLPKVMNEVDVISSVLDKNYKLMVQRDHNVTEHMEADDFWTYSYTSAEDIMSYFTKSGGFISSIWTVLSVLLAYVFIMLPYLVADRDSRSKGLYAELRKSKEDNDEYLSNRI